MFLSAGRNNKINRIARATKLTFFQYESARFLFLISNSKFNFNILAPSVINIGNRLIRPIFMLMNPVQFNNSANHNNTFNSILPRNPGEFGAYCD